MKRSEASATGPAERGPPVLAIACAFVAGCGLDNDFDRFAYDAISSEQFVEELSARICAYALRCESKYPEVGFGQPFCDPHVLSDGIASWTTHPRRPLTVGAAEECLASVVGASCELRVTGLPRACQETLFRPQPEGAPCATEWDCQSLLCIHPADQCAQAVCVRRAEWGEACYASEDCATGLYCDDDMPRVCRSKGNETDACALADGCAEGLYCDPDTGTCSRRPGLGEPCSTLDGVDPCVGLLVCTGAVDPTCASGPSEDAACDGTTPCGPNLRCVANTCVPLVGAGQACASASNCPYPFRCTDGVCVLEPRLGDACDVSRPCLEGSCIADVCRLPTASQACGADELGLGTLCEEESYCRDGTCRRTLAEGSACMASPECSGDLVCPMSGGGAGQCTPCS